MDTTEREQWDSTLKTTFANFEDFVVSFTDDSRMRIKAGLALTGAELHTVLRYIGDMNVDYDELVSGVEGSRQLP